MRRTCSLELNTEVVSPGIIRNPFWVPRESREHSPASECYEWFHQPMRNFCRPINCDVISGFVSMSDIFSDVWIFVILCFPFESHRKSDAILWICVLFLVCFVMDH
jgi:hypothetical protein